MRYEYIGSYVIGAKKNQPVSCGLRVDCLAYFAGGSYLLKRIVCKHGKHTISQTVSMSIIYCQTRDHCNEPQVNSHLKWAKCDETAYYTPADKVAEISSSYFSQQPQKSTAATADNIDCKIYQGQSYYKSFFFEKGTDIYRLFKSV